MILLLCRYMIFNVVMIWYTVLILFFPNEGWMDASPISCLHKNEIEVITFLYSGWLDDFLSVNTKDGKMKRYDRKREKDRNRIEWKGKKKESRVIDFMYSGTNRVCIFVPLAARVYSVHHHYQIKEYTVRVSYITYYLSKDYTYMIDNWTKISKYLILYHRYIRNYATTRGWVHMYKYI